MRRGEEMNYTDLRSKIVFVTEREKIEKSVFERKAYALATYWMLKDIKIENTDMLAGNLEIGNISSTYPCNLEQEIDYLEKDNKILLGEFDWTLTAREIGLLARAPGAHLIPAYDVLLRTGLQDKIEQIKQKMKENQSEIEKYSFYRGEMLIVTSMQKYIERYAIEAKRIYEETAKENIKRIYEACEWITLRAPRNFFEAVQSVFLAHMCVLDEGGSGSISFGRIDQYLYPYYQKDMQEGVLTQDEAQQIINALWEKISQCEKTWQNITLGGCDKNGRDVYNELTIMCMKASIATRKDQPQISLRVHEDMPEEVWRTTFELIQTGMGFPELYNDKITVKAKRNAGIHEEDAWNYAIIGCVEPAIGGKEYSHTEGIRINWAKLLELLLHGGTCHLSGREWELAENHELNEFRDFSSFYEWYKREFVYFTEKICRFGNEVSVQYAKYWPISLTSSLMQGCIEKGKDVTDCGTIYHNLTVNCVGVASVVNSLEAVEELVFKEKIVGLEELSDALKHNFNGYEWLQKKMRTCAKYGNDIPSVDNKVQELTKLFTDTLREQEVYSGGKWQAGFYTSYFHATMGELTGALPDGRGEGEALSSSLSPMAGTDINGPTAVINSANVINMEHFSNGMVLDMKFTPSFLEKKEHKKAIQMLVEEYFEAGGMEIQFNVVDKETLLDAQKNPIKYRDLVVRVSGFSAYFVGLEKSLQDEIIRRTEQSV